LKIILMRHGEAESSARSDAGRNLTAHGESQVRACAKGAYASQKVSLMMVERIVASPFLRAQQTAVLAQNLFSPPIPIETWSEITPSGKNEAVLDKLGRSKAAALLLVTHQPFVSNFVFYLTGSEIRMGTASMVSIQMNAMMVGCGEVDCELHSEF
jgi:phosphohistidine phosphatase